jgi:putative tryptophan/tyrosine transport system substrate-binding protein
MRRREFITLLSGVAAPLLGALAARAQQPRGMRRIGVLNGLHEGDSEGRRWVDAFIGSLHEFGWKQNENIQIEIRWGGGDVIRTNAMAAELVASNPEAIQASTTLAVAAVLQQTRVIPVVFAAVSDPFATGFVSSLARPGGNITGFLNDHASIGGKWLELLKEVAPYLAHVTVLYSAITAAAQTAYYRPAIEAAAASFALTLQWAAWQDERQLEEAIVALQLRPDGGLIVIPTAHSPAQRELIVSRANAHRIPAVFPFPFWVRGGGLISYGVDFSDLHRRAAGYMDRILRGANPGELPVQLPTKFELAINLKAAAALGLNVPGALLGRADEVIE